MKILFLSCNDFAPWGGSEVLWYRGAMALRSQGHSVCVNAKRWIPRPDHIQSLAQAGCDVIERAECDVNEREFRWLRWVVAQLRRRMGGHTSDIPDEFASVSTFRPDIAVINQGSFLDGAIAGLMCVRFDCPYIVVAQLVDECSFYGDHEIALLDELYQRARAILFVSRQNQRVAEKMVGRALPNSQVVSNPFRALASPPPFPAATEKYWLACIAQLNPFHKAHPLLFEALADKRWRNRELHVNVYGHGIAENTYKSQIRYFGLTNVTMCGYQADIEDIWSRHQGLILCSRMEGQSLALIEAMHCARVPIVTNVGGAAELVEHGVNGFLVDSPTVGAISRTLEEAWERRTVWQPMGEKARQSVLEKLPADPVADFCEQVLSLVGKP